MTDPRTVHRIREALASLATIVVGVLIALAADGWIQSKEDDKRVADLTARLTDEVRADSTGLEQFLELALAGGAAGERLILELEGGALVPPDSLPGLVRSVSNPPVFPEIRRATYVEIISTGSLTLIPSELRAEVLRYYERIDWWERTIPRATSFVTAPWFTELPLNFYLDPRFEVPPETLRRVVLRSPGSLQALRQETSQLRVYVVLYRQALSASSQALGVLNSS